ncbi:MAG: hypothetical protein HKN39_02280 [Flavobacteriales bacterium]|nr:hypothetical protein [Flavobacteriales bacterium]
MTKKVESQNPLDAMLENIKNDQIALKEHEEQFAQAKEAKRIIVQRLKDYRKDLYVFMKYANEKQKKRIEELGFEISESENGFNLIARTVLDILKDKKKMTNQALHLAYEKSVPKEQEPLNYTQFNIKLRSLFNQQVIVREKGDDPATSRSDIIRLNG